MEREKACHSVIARCRVLGVSTSGYYAWRKRGVSARAKSDAELTERIVQIHQANRGTYGAPRIWAELRLGHGIHRSRKRVARLTREAGIAGVHRRRRHGITRRDPDRSPYPDLVRRDFVPAAPPFRPGLPQPGGVREEVARTRRISWRGPQRLAANYPRNRGNFTQQAIPWPPEKRGRLPDPSAKPRDSRAGHPPVRTTVPDAG